MAGGNLGMLASLNFNTTTSILYPWYSHKRFMYSYSITNDYEDKMKIYTIPIKISLENPVLDIQPLLP